MKNKSLIGQIIKNRYIYLLLIPGIIYYIIFLYVPMYGITLAFKEFVYGKGIIHSPWTGLVNFQDLFRFEDFWIAFRNTIVISLQRLIFVFPVPIILALMLNEITKSSLKRIYQTAYTFPYFLSWVVVTGIMISIFSDSGSFNRLLIAMGGEKTSVLMNPVLFRPLLYISDIWKTSGWNAIIYLATISSINPELYEAGKIDGTNRWQDIKYITWPGIKGTVAVLLILAVGNLMNGGFDQIFNMYNAAVADISEIIDTYIYKITFQRGGTFGISTAAGLFKSVINFAFLIAANNIVKRMGQEGIA